MERYAQGVDAYKFRIDFKDNRGEIDRLTGWLIKESYESNKRVYRPTLIALPLIEGKRAAEILELINRILGYFAKEYQRERDRSITLGEISSALGAQLELVADAVGFIVESPASGSRSIGLPNGVEWFFIPGESALDFPDLDSVIRQQIAWEQPVRGSRWEGWHRRIKENRIFAGFLIVVGAIASWLGIFGNVADAILKITQLVTGQE